MRKIKVKDKSVFLTFDDGIDPVSTPRVLDVLDKHNAKATFFVIANKISGQVSILNRMLAAGHSIGNHSLDHRYRRYFSGQRGLQKWIWDAEQEFAKFGIKKEMLVGFRPPAGVVTPPLRSILKANGEPLVLWSERFYDAIIPWTAKMATKSSARLRDGDIVLLHDQQSIQNIDRFCIVLEQYILALKKRGFILRALSRNILLTQNLVS